MCVFFPVGYNTAFLCKGTPDNAIVFCLGAVLNSEINKKHQNVKTVVSQRMLLMVSELKQEGSASPCQLGTCGQDSKFVLLFMSPQMTASVTRVLILKFTNKL